MRGGAACAPYDASRCYALAAFFVEICLALSIFGARLEHRHGGTNIYCEELCHSAALIIVPLSCVAQVLMILCLITANFGLTWALILQMRPTSTHFCTVLEQYLDPWGKLWLQPSVAEFGRTWSSSGQIFSQHRVALGQLRPTLTENVSPFPPNFGRLLPNIGRFRRTFARDVGQSWSDFGQHRPKVAGIGGRA